MKKIVSRLLSWCFPPERFDSSWRTMLSLSVIRPPLRHGRMRKGLVRVVPEVQHDLFLGWTLSLAIVAVGLALVRLLF